MAIIEESIDDQFKRTGSLFRNAAGQDLEYRYLDVHQKFIYDDAGRLLRVMDISGPGPIYDQKTYLYDAVGSLKQELHWDESHNLTYFLTNAYDSLGQLASCHSGSLIANTETMVLFRYDTSGKLSHELRSSTPGDTIRVEYRYDEVGNLQAEEFYEDGTLTLSYQHTYDAKGQRSQTHEAAGPKRELFMTTTFAYNADGHKISETCSPRLSGRCNGDRFWEYNEAGWLTREYEKNGDELLNDKRYRWQ